MAECSIVGGEVSLPGAVILAGIAALRAGAGKLQIATCWTHSHPRRRRSS